MARLAVRAAGGGDPLPERLVANSVNLITARNEVRLVTPLVDPTTGRGERARPLDLVPGQLYLHVANTDLNDPAAVEKLIARIGSFGLDRYSHGVYGAPFAGHVDHFNDYEDEVSEDLISEGIDYLPDGIERRWMALRELDDDYETLEQFLAAAGLIKDAVTLKRLLIDGHLDIPDWEMLDIYAYNHPIWDNDTYHQNKGRLKAFGSDTAQALAWLLDQSVTSALAAFGPRLHERFTGSRGQLEVDLWAHVPLYSVMMAELFNHIVSQAPTRRCANTRCNQLFAYQEGRVVKGTSRSKGVLYCSAACARAVAQRAYRQRKRELP